MTEPAYRTTRKVLSVPVCWDDCGATYNISVAEKSFSRNPFRKEVQCTLSLCMGVLVFTIVTFLLCAHDPSKVSKEPWRPAERAVQHQFDVRLSHRPWRSLQASSVAANNESIQYEGGKLREQQQERQAETALEGMGTLFRRGRRAMSELLVAHLAENTTTCDLRLFLRTLHRSGMTARADIILLFPWRPLPAAMVDVIHEEEESFHKLLKSSKPLGAAAQSKLSDAGDALRPFAFRDCAGSSNIHTAIPAASTANISVFNAAAFWQSSSEASTSRGRSIWGNRSYHDISARVSEGSEAEDLNGSAYGAIVGFDVQELDPADAMRAFVNEPPAALRRWMCYQILLGMVRQKYHHVMLSEVRGLLILKDMLAPLKKKDTGLYVFAYDRKWDDRVSLLESRQPAVGSRKPGQTLIDSDDEDDLDRDSKNVLETRVENSSKVTTVLSEGQDGELDQDFRVRKLTNKRAKSMESEKADPRGTDDHQRGVVQAGLIEQVYGKQLWDSLEKEDKRRRVLSSGVIMGGMRSVRTLASAMATEIVRVAILRKSRQPFDDEAILSYLVHKSSVLGKKLASHLHIVVASGDSSLVNLLSGSLKLQSMSSSGSSTMFFRSLSTQSNGESLGTTRFAVIQGSYSASHETRNNLVASLHKDICKFSSRLADHSRAYRDCMELQSF